MIGIDVAESVSQPKGYASSGTMSFTVNDIGTGARMLVVGFVGNTGQSVSTVTYDGESLTQLETVVNSKRCDMWVLEDPPVGTANIVITLSGSLDKWTWGADLIYNLDSDTPYTASGTLTYTTTYGHSFSVSCPSLNSMLYSVGGVNGAESSFDVNSWGVRTYKEYTAATIHATMVAGYWYPKETIASSKIQWTWDASSHYLASCYMTLNPCETTILIDARTERAAPGGSSVTISHTVAAKHNRVLTVFVENRDASDIFSATYNGVSMTKFEFRSSTDISMTGFYLANPATGANDVVVSLSSGNMDDTCISVMSIYNAEETPHSESGASDTSAHIAEATLTSDGEGSLGLIALGKRGTVGLVGDKMQQILHVADSSGQPNSNVLMVSSLMSTSQTDRQRWSGDTDFAWVGATFDYLAPSLTTFTPSMFWM